MNWLLIFVPISAWLHYTRPASHTETFLCACLAILPLAGWLGKGTENLAHHTGEAVGGLLNATFGNAAELIIAIAAMRSGLYDVVKASLTGSIIGNVLLVAGLSFLTGGLKYKTQTFNRMAAQNQATMLLLAAVSLILPAAYHYLAGPAAAAHEGDLSLEISIILLVVYAASLVFTLVTHKALFGCEGGEAHGGEAQPWSVGKSVAVLAGATALIAWISEILVGSVEHAAHSFGMTSVFVGVIVVAIIGNAAEHSTAVLVARKNRMDLALGIAIGSSIQIALFVAPVLVLLSYFLAPHPMNLVFTPAEVLAVTLSVLINAQVANDGESNWMEGLQMLAVYAILGAMFYFLPEAHVK
ncbi:MAG: calcium/proton exchanger [Acidobacteria bacterium]|nr:calcium/proton exchanger [Acidobacteriota bacterium]